MSETVQVAVIAASAGVLGGLGPALLAGVFTRRQARHDAERQHANWLREHRYGACTDLLDAANMLGHRTNALRVASREATLPKPEVADRFLNDLAPMFAAVNRLGVLGPPELAKAAGFVGQAAVGCQTANARGTTETSRPPISRC